MTAKSTTPAALTWRGVTTRRMPRHAFTEPAADLGPAGVAWVLCGVHAQVLSAAELSIGRRIARVTRADVRRALWEERTLVKTFGPRGTIHLLSTVDLPMWTGALSALPSSVPEHPEGVRSTAGQADEVIAAIGDALADAGPGGPGDLAARPEPADAAAAPLTATHLSWRCPNSVARADYELSAPSGHR